MRRLLFSAALAALGGTSSSAQTPAGSEGSLFLLLPTGAQAVGMGQAMVAAKPGSEGIWWNPASIGDQEKRELAIHHSKTVAGVGDALTFVLPTRSFGSAALSVNILNIGDQQVKDEFDNVVGVVLPRDVVFAATYAGNISRRLTAGLNYKVVQLRVDCSGECSSVGAEVQSSRALDLGAQYQMAAGAPLTFGAAIRNLGGRLNSRETNQRDPLPTQVEAGVMYRLKFLDHYVKDTELRAAGSFVNSRSFGGKSVRFGTDVMYQGRVHLRAGYVGHDQRGNASAALGFGLQSDSFVFDIARTFGGLPADDGQAPVYVSLRYLF
ncbi:MAG TPA: PorV/PorQ family protein [Gemmatimonadaceae bacterium]|nr:PorV/PorQ family protein [Gemmatimonadaceae bacterium]